ncbi:MAG: tetratricopeptide repeat protein [Acidiferrobacterales bacterium]
MMQSKLSQCCGILLIALTLGTAYAGTVSQAEERLFNVQLRLAKSGDPNGEFYVGEMYEQGLGTPRNLELAHAWYEKSADKGNIEAKDKLANWDEVVKHAADSQQQVRAAARAKAQAEARAKAQALAQARALAQQKAQALALARERAAAERARKRAAAEAAAKKLEHERAEALARAREHAAALRARKIAEEKAQAEARQRATAIAAAKSREAAAAVAHAKKPAPEVSSSTHKNKHHVVQFSPNPCKGVAAQFLSTCH